MSRVEFAFSPSDRVGFLWFFFFFVLPPVKGQFPHYISYFRIKEWGSVVFLMKHDVFGCFKLCLPSAVWSPDQGLGDFPPLWLQAFCNNSDSWAMLDVTNNTHIKA